MYLQRDDNRVLLAFLLLSLLLHLALLLLAPEMRMLPEPDTDRPVYVEVRPSLRSRELDLPKEENQKRDKPAERLGPSDRVVEKEVAPKGDFIEDRQSSAPAAPAAPQPEVQPERAPADSGETARPAPPDISKLLTLPRSTVARLDDEWRTKYRAEVEEGESIWLDTEQDLLISFYQRLRSGIYRVWNYPAKSREAGEAGTCLIRMSFNRDGSVKTVELLESSGFPRLDREAVAAVYKGAPYGKLPEAYKKDDLSILAFFRYTISDRYISN